ncbi:MAG: hypothetical protein WCO00_04955 [Rhodospirillaceae bacterium]
MVIPKSVSRHLTAVALASMVVMAVLAGCVAVPYAEYPGYQNEQVYYGRPTYVAPVVVAPRPAFGYYGGHHHHHHWR